MTEEELVREGFGNMTGKELIQAGFEIGFKRGFEEAPRRVLLQLLRERFGDEVDAMVEVRVAAASLPQIDRWFDRLVPWPKLTALLAD